ncbi:hypothetical protein [Paenibacillus prosopidis]|uniref:Uncharacterized protein n=1 Tax=Paenibacillus prosopidis TaxID=630520 RepID=A0A368W9M0_9BACL|nr:hypothetical protein [Paenibacillus prosopidis]RCW50236.1 hypothetical protein DFP97_103254 [Paenibacillus prosopidis]
MSSDVQNNLQRIVRELGVDDIVALLSERISGADFNTLLLEVFREKTNKSSPSATNLLALHISDLIKSQKIATEKILSAYQQLTDMSGLNILETNPGCSPTFICFVW